MRNFTNIPNLAPTVQNGRQLKIRSAYIEFYEGDENGQLATGTTIVTLQGLNTRFNVEENFGNFFPKASVGVCNLNQESRDFLTNYMNMKDLQFNKRIMRLYAGYLDPDDMSKQTPYIFGGNVMYTRFSDPPDIWFDMDVVYNNVASVLQSVEWTHKGKATSTEILQECAEKLKVGIDIRDTPKETVTNFTASGDGQSLMKQLRNTFLNHAIFISNGNLVVLEKERETPAPGETVWEMREDTGMIGLPVVEYWGVEIQCLLNPAIHPGDWIKLYSVNQPKANGTYHVRRVTHHGELRGTEFCTRLEAFYPSGDKSKK